MLIKSPKTKSAFSLIELAIVIGAIAALVAVIANTNRLSANAGLAAAQALTKASPVIDIDDSNLILWLETTMAKSFAVSSTILPANNDTISTWYDLSSNNNNATAGNAPTYVTNAINGLPALYFNGSNDYLGFNGASLANSNYTIIVVEERLSNNSQSFFISGNSNTSNQALQLGYRNGSDITWDQGGNNCDVSVASYTAPTPRIHTFIFNSAIGKNYYLNGTNQTFDVASCDSPTVGLSSYSSAYIGNYFNTYFYNGNIAEIIIFSRALTGNEQNDIQKYLSTKWGVTVTVS